MTLNASRFVKRIVHLVTSASIVGIGGYAIYAAVAWVHYGRPNLPGPDESDPLLDGFMPAYEAVERHGLRVAAPASITFSAACEMNIQQSRLIRSIFKSRELILGGKPANTVLPHGLVEQMKALGWGVLAEIPEREIVMGAITKPWEANVVFRAVQSQDYLDFRDPGFVKIVWTLRADPNGPSESVFRTETRVTTTDSEARRKFRLYWSFFSPGIELIRRISLGPLKTEAERRAQKPELVGE